MYKCPLCGKKYSNEEYERYNRICPVCNVELVKVEEGYKTGSELRGSSGKKYVLETNISSGGQAVLWKGKEEDSGKEVILKLFNKEDKEWRERIKKIVEIYKKLDKVDNVLDLEDYSMEEGFLVFRYLPGRLDKSLFWENGRINYNRLEEFIMQMTGVLKEIHLREIIHRDIKPGNILYEEHNVELKYYLIDFGIATMSSVTTVMMTPRYSPPELVELGVDTNKKIAGKMTKKIDYWSLGVTILEMVGDNPFESTEDVIKFKRDEYLDSLEIEDRYRMLLKGLLTKNPEKRWGEKQMVSWLSGEIPIVAKDSENYLRIEVGENVYYDYNDLARGLLRNYEVGMEKYSEVIGRLMSAIEGLSAYYVKEVESDVDKDRKYLKLVYYIARSTGEAIELGYKGYVFNDLKELGDFLRSEDTKEVVSEMRQKGIFSLYFGFFNEFPYEEVRIDEKVLKDIEEWEKRYKREESVNEILIYLVNKEHRDRRLKLIEDKIKKIKKEYVFKKGMLDKIKALLFDLENYKENQALISLENILKNYKSITESFDKEEKYYRKDVMEKIALASEFSEDLEEMIPTNEEIEEKVAQFNNLLEEIKNGLLSNEVYIEKYAEFVRLYEEVEKRKDELKDKNEILKRLDSELEKELALVKEILTEVEDEDQNKKVLELVKIADFFASKKYEKMDAHFYKMFINMVQLIREVENIKFLIKNNSIIKYLEEKKVLSTDEKKQYWPDSGPNSDKIKKLKEEFLSVDFSKADEREILKWNDFFRNYFEKIESEDNRWTFLSVIISIVAGIVFFASLFLIGLFPKGPLKLDGYFTILNIIAIAIPSFWYHIFAKSFTIQKNSDKKGIVLNAFFLLIASSFSIYYFKEIVILNNSHLNLGFVGWLAIFELLMGAYILRVRKIFPQNKFINKTLSFMLIAILISVFISMGSNSILGANFNLPFLVIIVYTFFSLLFSLFSIPSGLLYLIFSTTNFFFFVSITSSKIDWDAVLGYGLFFWIFLFPPFVILNKGFLSLEKISNKALNQFLGKYYNLKEERVNIKEKEEKDKDEKLSVNKIAFNVAFWFLFMVLGLMSVNYYEGHLYKKALNKNSIKSYEKYLTLFPKSKHSEEIKSRIKKLKDNKIDLSVLDDGLKKYIYDKTKKFALSISKLKAKPFEKILINFLIDTDGGISVKSVKVFGENQAWREFGPEIEKNIISKIESIKLSKKPTYKSKSVIVYGSLEYKAIGIYKGKLLLRKIEGGVN